jgi:hypothetical protein
MRGCKVQFCLPKVQFNQTTGVYSFTTKGSVYYIGVYIILGSWILLALCKAYNDLQSNIVEKVILWLLIIDRFTMTMMPSLSSDCDAVHI